MIDEERCKRTPPEVIEVSAVSAPAAAEAAQPGRPVPATNLPGSAQRMANRYPMDGIFEMTAEQPDGSN